MTPETVKALSDSELVQVIAWAQTETKARTERRPALRRTLAAGCTGQIRGIAQPPQRPEIVPISMHGLRKIALVAHRDRQQPIRAEQSFDARDRLVDVFPALL